MPAITCTLAQIQAMDPCDMDRRIALFGKRKKMNARQALEAGASISDLLWVAGRLGRKDLCINFALAVAQRTAHLDKSGRAQACLDATAVYIADETPENLATMREKRKAAADAAAYAAAAAAYAAYAADAAAYAAAAAAYAADAAAYAAYADARQKEIDAQREIFLEIFG